MADQSEVCPPGSGAVGCYLLRLELTEPVELVVGKTGSQAFLSGSYLYVGSAFGSGGVRGRLRHHLRRSDRPRWHIDYLRRHAPIDQIWFAETELRLEHHWADALVAMPGSRPLMPGLGASDCGCASHLFYFQAPPELAEFSAALAGLVELPITNVNSYALQCWRAVAAD